jgi:hypothetical protein
MSHPRGKRVRGGFGAVDPLSDEETEIDISAISNSASGELKYSYAKTTSKHTKTNSGSNSQPSSVPSSILASNPTSSSEPVPLSSSQETQSNQKEARKCPQVRPMSENL